MDRVSFILEECKSKKVLDIGCTGIGGRLHEKITQVSSKAVGIDIDQEKVNVMNKKGYEVYCQNAENFNFDQKFDVIVAGELIEHLENPGIFLDSVKEHLFKGGRLIITTPNLQSAHKIKQNIVKSNSNENHILGFTKYLLRNLLRKKGFNIIKIRNIEHDEEAMTLRGKFSNFFYQNR